MFSFRLAAYSCAVLGVCFATTSAFATPEFCRDLLYEMRGGPGRLGTAPQVAAVTGDRNDFTITLRSYPREKVREHEILYEAETLALTERLATDVSDHSLLTLRVEATEENVGKFERGLAFVLSEAINNASYHGNEGNHRRAVTIRVRRVGEKGETTRIEIDDESARFFDGNKRVLAPLTTEEIVAMYEAPDGGGGLGGRLVLQNYIEQYKLRVRYEPIRSRGATLGTRVVVEFEPRSSIPGAK